MDPFESFKAAQKQGWAHFAPLEAITTPTAARLVKRAAIHAGQRVLDALRGDQRPKLILWADSDPVLPLETGRRFATVLGAEIDHVIADAGHFLQEDAGPEIGALIADWLRSGN